MARSHSRGSEWRRWDLHVHTPETALNNQFSNDWEAYLSRIEAESDVKVLGVTDYFTITNYSKLKRYKEDGRIQNIEYLIPNIEFRIAQQDGNSVLNLHLLINPDSGRHEQKIEAALNRLTYQSPNGPISCNRQQLIFLGGKHLSNNVSDNQAFEKGCIHFKPEFGEFINWLKKEKWLFENSLLAIPGGSDGASIFIKDDGSWDDFYEKVLLHANIVFSGQPCDRKFWLGKRFAEGVEEKEKDLHELKKVGGFKPCVHGSDAHSLEQLFKPDLDRFCWIKAAPTFDGLKQILYEPEERVWIGKKPPDSRDPQRIIARLKVENSPNWLDWGSEIELNAGLVCIIGNKGSGKTALLDIIAYVSGAWDEENDQSFIKKASEPLKDAGMRASITWRNGTEESQRDIYASKHYSNDDKKVRYLSQQFVEQLCAVTEKDKLNKEIEGVIFEYITQEDRMGCSSFVDLKSKKLEAINVERSEFENQLNDGMQRWGKLHDLLSSCTGKQNEINRLIEERKNIIPPKIQEKAMQTIADEIQHLQELDEKMKGGIAEIHSQLNELDTIEAQVRLIKDQARNYYISIKESLTDLGFEDIQIREFEMDFKDDPFRRINEKRDNLKTEIIQETGSEDSAPGKQTLWGLFKLIEERNNRLTIDQTQRAQWEEQQRRMRDIDSQLTSLEQEIANINAAFNNKVTYRNNISTPFKSFFSLLNREIKTLETLYGALQNEISSDSEGQNPFQINIELDVDVGAWVEKGNGIINHKVKSKLRDESELRSQALKLLPHWKSGDAEALDKAIWQFLKEMQADEDVNVIEFEKQLKQGYSYKDFLMWVFDLSHIKTGYSLKYNDLPLASMSPGTKGLVLLMLYLDLNKDDRRPLLVDQPEENLDNDSVYRDLRQYFRKAKKRRQIIMVTHNPNLVVNTDAEQVIVTDIEESETGKVPKLSMHSGSIEDKRIREDICVILEGGRDAFKKREDRYGLPDSG